MTGAEADEHAGFVAGENGLVGEIRQAGWSLRATLELLGISRSTWQYRHRPRPRAEAPIAHGERDYPNRVPAAEQERIVALLTGGFAAGRSVYAAWYRALDDGDPIASMATWHRLARTHLAAQRPIRRQRRRRTTAMPQFDAARPNQVWCWDITKLPGKYRKQWLNFYVVIDAFSRLIVAWRVETTERDDLARDMFTTAFAVHQTHPDIVHSDGGPSMMSDTLAELYRSVGITRSKNRPRVSNDNPHAESVFKTAKYQRGYPDWFEDLDHARSWATTMVKNYNTSHRHSGLEGHTPQSVHDGTWRTIHNTRQATLNKLAARHPERYPTPPLLPTPYANVRLNLEKPTERLQTA